MDRECLGSDLVNPAVKLLSTAIAIILEDHREQALAGSAPERFEELQRTGEHVAALSAAAGILLSRR
jgi:hypothetical protein